jgi:putative spermidine/putrescine transport system permease protein
MDRGESHALVERIARGGASRYIMRQQTWTALCVVPLALLLAVVFLYPIATVLWQSLHDTDNEWTLRGYRELIGGGLFPRVLENTLEICIISTFATLLLAYPVAYHLALQSPSRRALLLALVMIPFWTSILVKSFAFTVILGHDGFVVKLLGLVVDPPPKLLFNRTGVVIGFVHFFIPFMVFPILGNLLSQDSDLPKAARIMGAGSWRIFWTITVPLSLPGVLAGSLLTFVTALGFFITPALLGGRKEVMVANLVDFYTRQLLDWTLASGVAILLLVITVVLIVLLIRVPGARALLGRHT